MANTLGKQLAALRKEKSSAFVLLFLNAIL